MRSTEVAHAGSTGMLSIGAVLELLRAEFPDVTISKIRFLESAGLVHPSRTPAGYRQFVHAEVDRLRFVLAAQRDQYLPLRVIREQLDARDDAAGETPGPASSPRPWETGNSRPMTREALLAAAAISVETLARLEETGVVRPGRAGYYDSDAAALASTAHALLAAGMDPRQLAALRAAADREANLLGQMLTPLSMQSDPEASSRAEETVRELTALSARLHTLLVRAGLREALHR